MKKKKGRFSKFLKPVLLIFDLLSINYFILYFFDEFENILLLMVLASLSWIVITIFTQFYRVYRFTPEIKIFSLILIQYLIFTISFFSILGLISTLRIFSIESQEFNTKNIILLTSITTITIAVFKFAVYFLILRFRVIFGGNYRKTIIVGSSKQAENLKDYFNNVKEAGFKLKKIFGSKNLDLKVITEYISNESIDEVYCCLSSVKPQILNLIVNYAESNLKEVKFIPDFNKVYSKKLSYQNYDLTPFYHLGQFIFKIRLTALLKDLLIFFFHSQS